MCVGAGMGRAIAPVGSGLFGLQDVKAAIRLVIRSFANYNNGFRGPIYAIVFLGGARCARLA